MSIKRMKNDTFLQQAVTIWKQKAEEALKGKPLESLSTNTYEQIQLQPLYTADDLKSHVSQFPGQSDFRRGSSTLGYLDKGWEVAQKLNIKSEEKLKEELIANLEKGQTTLSFPVDQMNLNNFESFIGGLYSKYPFSIETNEKQTEVLTKLSKLTDCEKISGYIASDPLTEHVMTGIENLTYDNWVSSLQTANKMMPNLRTIFINTSKYHNAGANAVQELSIALALGVHYIHELLQREFSLEDIISKFVFNFSIGANFFMEIAKLRAARILWSKIAESYGAGTEAQKMVISAETSSFTKTVYDPYVNILRAGNEAFAAVLGGVQYLHVSPYNEPEGHSTAFSERIARNIQLILKKEAHLERIIDPAGGSWYVESLTNELAEKAWALFLEIEEKDGIANALKSGWLQEKINEVLKRRKEDIYTRKQSIIGTNMYANLNDKGLKISNIKGDSVISQVRLSEPFEKLRAAAEKMEQSGIKPVAGLICLGELKAHKARADFMTSFFATGGIHSIKSQNIAHFEMALQFVKETKINHYVICGTDKQYEEYESIIMALVKEKQPNIKIYLAGLPEAEKRDQWKKLGIAGFIHLHSNCYETLSILLSEMEVASNG